MFEMDFFFNRWMFERLIIREAVTAIVKAEEELRISTNKSFLLEYHKHMVENMTELDEEIGSFTYPQKNESSPFSCTGSKLNLGGAERIEILDFDVDRRMKGKYFLCRAITTPYKILPLMTIVDDLKGIYAVRLQISNYTGASVNKSVCSRVLPIGSVLVIKSPLFEYVVGEGYVVKVDNPVDIVFVPEENFDSIFPGLTWQGNTPYEYGPDWIDTGKKLFTAKKYGKTMECYNEGLKYFPDDVSLLANRAAVSIKLGCFYRADEDTEKVLKMNPNHEKGIFRKAQILGEFKKYAEAIAYVSAQMKTNASIQNKIGFVALLNKLKKLEEQKRTGKYDFVTLYKEKQKFHDDLADFTGPVKIDRICGKGRGLVATEDIEAGQLLLLSKAFVISYKDEEWKLKDSSNLESLVIKKVEEKLMVEPEFGKEFYQLYAGPEMCPFEEILQDDICSVDIKRITGIIKYNAFYDEIDDIREEWDKGLTSTSNVTKMQSVGVWILPSFINHSCWDCNCFCSIVGDVIIIRAFKNISSGEEILIPYCSPTVSYGKRKLDLQKFGFECSCSLCKYESNEEKYVRDYRKKTVKRIVKFSDKPTHVEYLIGKLENQRSTNPGLNVDILPSLQRTGEYFFQTGELEKSREYFIKAHGISKNSSLVTTTAEFAVNVLHNYASAGDDETEIQKWIEIVKRDLRIAYGSEGFMEVIGKGTLSLLQKCGIPFD